MNLCQHNYNIKEPLKGWGDLGESVKKGKFVIKFFLQIVLSEVLKVVKMISANEKQEIKELVAASRNFLYKHL